MAFVLANFATDDRDAVAWGEVGGDQYPCYSAAGDLQMNEESTITGDFTMRDFSEGLGWLIINSQSGGVSIEDQITVLRCALKALQEAFP
jgi:hypothetical protein